MFYTVTASGGCSPPNIVANPPSGSTFPIGTTTVTATASDTCGNSATCSFTVTVYPPALDCLPVEYHDRGDRAGWGECVLQRQCQRWVQSAAVCHGQPAQRQHVPDRHHHRAGHRERHLRQFHQLQFHGDRLSADRHRLPEQHHRPATGPSGAVVFYTVTASGGCSPPNIVANPPSGSTFPIGTTTVFATASDTCGNSANCSFTVTVYQPVAIACPSNITTAATGPSGANVFFTVNASGGCSPPPFVTANPPSGSTFPIGTTTVLATASDTCGNSTNCSFTVTVYPDAHRPRLLDPTSRWQRPARTASTVFFT